MSLRKPDGGGSLTPQTHRRNNSAKNTADKRVKFPHDLIFEDLLKDGDSNEMVGFLRRQSVTIDLDKPNESGTTPLTNLIKTGNLKCIRAIVTLGADVNRRDEFGWCPLHYAASYGFQGIAKFLIESGADPDAKDEDGLTPVDYTDDFEMIELLTLSSPSAEGFSGTHLQDLDEQ